MDHIEEEDNDDEDCGTIRDALSLRRRKFVYDQAETNRKLGMLIRQNAEYVLVDRQYVTHYNCIKSSAGKWVV
jgi:hypothetical protein